MSKREFKFRKWRRQRWYHKIGQWLIGIPFRIKEYEPEFLFTGCLDRDKNKIYVGNIVVCEETE